MSLRREIAHVRSNLRPSRTRPWPRTCAAAWPEPWKALAHRVRRQSDKPSLGLDVVLLVQVHLHAAVLVGAASAEQVVAGVVALRVAGLGRDPKPRNPTRYVGGASRRGRPVDTPHRGRRHQVALALASPCRPCGSPRRAPVSCGGTRASASALHPASAVPSPPAPRLLTGSTARPPPRLPEQPQEVQPSAPPVSFPGSVAPWRAPTKPAAIRGAVAWWSGAECAHPSHLFIYLVIYLFNILFL
jgi:hypothetical protein